MRKWKKNTKDTFSKTRVQFFIDFLHVSKIGPLFFSNSFVCCCCFPASKHYCVIFVLVFHATLLWRIEKNSGSILEIWRKSIYKKIDSSKICFEYASMEIHRCIRNILSVFKKHIRNKTAEGNFKILSHSEITFLSF